MRSQPRYFMFLLNCRISIYAGLIGFTLLNPLSPCFATQSAHSQDFDTGADQCDELDSLACKYSLSIAKLPEPPVLSKFLSEQFLPAQTIESLNVEINQDFFRRYRLNSDWQIRKFFVETPDHEKLDSIEILPPNFDFTSEDAKVVIAFNGNGMTYVNYLDQLTQYGKEIKVASVGFNYRGVGQSTGHPRSFRRLVLDGITQTQRVLNRGVKAENITIDGHSLGGAIGAYVAAFFHNNDIKVKLFSDRSFASLDAVIRSKFPQIVAGTLIPVLPNIGWDLRPIDPFNSIDDDYKAFVYCTDDKVIDVNASLACLLNDNNRCKGVAAIGGHMLPKDWLNLDKQDRTEAQSNALHVFYDLVQRQFDQQAVRIKKVHLHEHKKP